MSFIVNKICFSCFIAMILCNLREIRYIVSKRHCWIGNPEITFHRYTDTLNQSNAVSCHFDVAFPEQVNFRLRAIFLILTLIIGKGIAVSILRLNGKEDWSWDSTDEMNFQWRLRSKIQNEGGQRSGKEQGNGEGEKEPFSLLQCHFSTPCSFLLSWCSTFSLVPRCYCSCTSFGNCWYFPRNLGRKHKTGRMRQGARVSRKERTEITLLYGF